MADTLTKEICKVLTRVPLMPGQITLFKALYETNTWMSTRDLKQMILTWRGADDETLRGLADSVGGVLSGIGRRVNETPDLRKKIGSQLLFETREAQGVKQYRMRSELRTVIDNLPMLHQAVQMTIEDIQRNYRHGIELVPSAGIC